MPGTVPKNPSISYHHSDNPGDNNDCQHYFGKGPTTNSSGSGDPNDIVLFAFYRKSDGRLTFVIYDDTADALAVVT